MVILTKGYLLPFFLKIGHKMQDIFCYFANIYTQIMIIYYTKTSISTNSTALHLKH